MTRSIARTVAPRPEQSVAELLDVDRELRSCARRLLHTERDGHHYTALYSPTALARRLGRESDWVIVDLETPGPNARSTVVTELRGVLRGRRVVRGREPECFEYYRSRRRRSAA